MEQARPIKQEEVQQSPLLRDVLERASAGTPSVLTYNGVTVAVVPVPDITHTFTEAELREFLLGWAESMEPDQLLTKEEALRLAAQRFSRHG